MEKTRPNVDDLPVLNAAIADRVKALSIQPKDLADRLDVRTQTVYKWLNGEITPPASRWRELEDVLSFGPGTFARLAGLLGDDTEPNRDELDEVILARIKDLRTEVEALAEVVRSRRPPQSEVSRPRQ